MPLPKIYSTVYFPKQVSCQLAILVLWLLLALPLWADFLPGREPVLLLSLASPSGIWLPSQALLPQV